MGGECPAVILNRLDPRSIPSAQGRSWYRPSPGLSAGALQRLEPATPSKAVGIPACSPAGVKL